MKIRKDLNECPISLKLKYLQIEEDIYYYDAKMT